jgi:tetratricopeptide (TPR) repeat protein
MAGRTLRITETAESNPGRYQIHVMLEGAGPRLAATVPLAFEITEQDRDNLRWYLEDYLQHPQDPAPERAARVEQRMEEIGDGLCKAVFFGNRDAQRLWDRAREDMRDMRVEVITDVRHAASIPWELIRDPESKTPLALEAQAFVRGHTLATKFARGTPNTSGGPIRILLVICRPAAGRDVPFRSVARKLVDGLTAASRKFVQLEVLRPPTFEALSNKLRDAKQQDKPYHVVHFDGHGVYFDEPKTKVANIVRGVNAHVLGSVRAGAHGYLVFESPEETTADEGQLVGGADLGNLLVETSVPVLVLNACRSAHADEVKADQDADDARDVHEDISRFGSLALEVMDAGVSGVVAMRYNVYVATAAKFVADMYDALVNGHSLGEAVTRGRKQLHTNPLRSLGYAPRQLRDWCVPVVYEVEALSLFPKPQSKREISLELPNKDDTSEHGMLVGVPHAPDVGFWGRDETLLALDRSFDKHPVALLHAYAGSGKTSTAAEFARWYAKTCGIDGPVLWTNFERHIVLAQVLDAVEPAFHSELKRNRIEWLTLSNEKRRSIALQLLRQIPVLWVWDNVEPVAGFPAGTASMWSIDEQRELVDFLREASQTEAKFLLTSRRDENAWLGDLPVRIPISPMPMLERVQLARALADKRRVRFEDIEAWGPLLSFTQGNPLTILVVTGQVFRDGLRSAYQIKVFVEKLRAGEKAFTDDETEGRSKSLGASLRYGFDAGFTGDDEKRLALLYLFHGFVDVQALKWMGTPDTPWCLPELCGLTQVQGIILLDRAAEMGILTALGDGYYSIHPAVPWFFRGLFEQHYPPERINTDGSDATEAMRAYVEAMGALGSFYYDLYANGRRDHLAWLAAEEPNLLNARILARRYGWWVAVITAMQGLDYMYYHTGRHAEWIRLMEETTHDFVDPVTDGPIPGREDAWGPAYEYRVRLAKGKSQWAEAERLQIAYIHVARIRAAEALTLAADVLDWEQRNRIRTLSFSLAELGHIQRHRGRAECITSYTEASEMAQRAGERTIEADISVNVGGAFRQLASIRDLAQAETWYINALNLYGEEQRHSRAICMQGLGSVALERFRETREAKRTKDEELDHIGAALRLYLEALELFPNDVVDDFAIIHGLLGMTYGYAGDVNRALHHYQNSIGYWEQMGDVYNAGHTRLDIAFDLAIVDRFEDAHLYALAALRDFETFGDWAADYIQQTKELIAMIERAMEI